jgi:hypothetical protein
MESKPQMIFVILKVTGRMLFFTKLGYNYFTILRENGGSNG